MNKEILKGKWLHAKEDVRNWWGKLTDDDVDQIQGNFETFILRLQERYRYSREEAEKELTDFLSMPDNERRRCETTDDHAKHFWAYLVPIVQRRMLFCAEEVGDEGYGIPQE